MKGGNVVFNVNSYAKAKDGIKYDNHTVIRINYNDPNPTSHGCALTVEALQPDMEGEYGSQKMPLSTLRVKGGFQYGGNNYNLSLIPLSASSQILYSHQGGMPTTDLEVDVNLSYELGTGDDKLLNYSSNCFRCDLQFTLMQLP